MVLESEIITLVLGVGVSVFIWFNRLELKKLAASKILIAAFGMFLAGWTLAIVENFLVPDFLNHLEHASHAIGSILVVLWCWKLFGMKEALK